MFLFNIVKLKNTELRIVIVNYRKGFACEHCFLYSGKQWPTELSSNAMLRHRMSSACCCPFLLPPGSSVGICCFNTYYLVLLIRLPAHVLFQLSVLLLLLLGLHFLPNQFCFFIFLIHPSRSSQLVVSSKTIPWTSGWNVPLLPVLFFGLSPPL